MNINKENIELLCRELETTKIPQSIGAYYDSRTESYCAVGVAGLVAGHVQHETDIVETLKNFYGPGIIDGCRVIFPLKDDGTGTIGMIAANDAAMQPFWTIAQRLRETYLKDES